MTIRHRVNLTHELARTWLVTVINPVLTALRREDTFLTSKNWTWRYYSERFEYLWPIAAYVDPLYRDNLEPFLATYAEVRKSAAEHDRLIEQFARSCADTARFLAASDAFRRAIEAAASEATAQGINVDEARGAVPASAWPLLLAEYLINNHRTLPEYYSTSGFWRVARETLLGVTRHDSIAREFDTLQNDGNELLVATRLTEEALVKIRKTYGERFGLPPVPITGAS